MLNQLQVQTEEKQENSTSSAESSSLCSNAIVNLSKSHFTGDIVTCVLYPAPETKRKQNDGE